MVSLPNEYHYFWHSHYLLQVISMRACATEPAAKRPKRHMAAPRRETGLSLVEMSTTNNGCITLKHMYIQLHAAFAYVHIVYQLLSIQLCTCILCGIRCISSRGSRCLGSCTSLFGDKVRLQAAQSARSLVPSAYVKAWAPKTSMDVTQKTCLQQCHVICGERKMLQTSSKHANMSYHELLVGNQE